MTLLVREPELGEEGLDEPVKERRGTTAIVRRPELVLLGAPSLGAAVLHAAFAPVHFTETWSHGLFFALLAWLSSGWPSRWWPRPRGACSDSVSSTSW